MTGFEATVPTAMFTVVPKRSVRSAAYYRPFSDQLRGALHRLVLSDRTDTVGHLIEEQSLVRFGVYFIFNLTIGSMG